MKTAIFHVGANISTASILQCGKSSKCLVSLLQILKSSMVFHLPSSAHTRASLAKDKSAMLEDAVRHSSNIFSNTGLANRGISIIWTSMFKPWDSYEVCARVSVVTWPSGDLISQNYLRWQAKESAQRYQTTFSAAILLAEMVGWERDYMNISQLKQIWIWQNLCVLHYVIE